MKIRQELYSHAAEYLRVSDPLVKELTVELALRAGLDHAQRFTGYSFDHKRHTVSLTNSMPEFRLLGKNTRNIAIRDTRSTVLRRYPDGTEKIILDQNVCDCCSREGSATLTYETGISSLEEMPASILMGILKYCAYIYENRGDANQANILRPNEALSRSGAMAEWNSYIRKVD